MAAVSQTTSNQRLFGHALAGLFAIAFVVGGIASLAKGLPPVMGVTMVFVGGLLPPLIWKSLQHSRAAWSFVIAILAVFAMITLFGAPKIRTVLGIDLGFALLIPALQITAIVVLAQLRDEYRD